MSTSSSPPRGKKLGISSSSFFLISFGTAATLFGLGAVFFTFPFRTTPFSPRMDEGASELVADDAVEDATEDAVEDATEEAVDDATEDAVEEAVDDAVEEAVEEAVEAVELATGVDEEDVFRITSTITHMITAIPPNATTPAITPTTIFPTFPDFFATELDLIP